MHCDICDLYIKNPADICTLYIQGIKEDISCHSDCLLIFFKCKGDFSLLPNGRLKYAIMKSSTNAKNDKMIKDTNITVRDKQARYVIKNLKKSHEEGMCCIKTLACDFYGLPKPNEDDNEYYTIDVNKKLLLMQRTLK
jgi:hypothetical protein